MQWSLGFSGVAAALAGAAAGACVAGALDAWSAAAEAGIAAVTLLPAAVALAAPPALVLGAACGAARWVLLGGRSASPGAAARWLSARQGRERAAWVLAPLLAALALALGLLAISGASASALSLAWPGRAVGSVLALSALSIVLPLVAGVQLLSSRFAEGRAESRLTPVAAAVLGIVAAGLLVGALIAFGETGGGGGPFKILGVLRRQELDLRAPALLLVVAVAALVVPAPRHAALALGLGAVAALPLSLTFGAAQGKLLDEQLALGIERHAPLGGKSLSLLRRLSDRDGDGMSAAFVGGDCDDADPSVNPRAYDVPGNGRDEDCSGEDARVVVRQTEKPAAVPEAGRAPLPKDLNVLLVTIDTMRADLGYMGYPRPVSPRLDALAKKSVVYERAYALASYTGKSLGPMLIGKYANEIDGGFLHFNRYSDQEIFVQQRLQAAGIRTLSVQGYWYFFKDYGYQRGFDVIDKRAAPEKHLIEGDQSSNSDTLSNFAIEHLQAPELEQKRFFMWVHYVDPHADYVPHEGFEFGKKQRDLYDGELAFVDHHVGRLLDALSARPFASRTAIIVTSDHGEAFGEHGMVRHGFELWEELVRVPLIVHVPGVAPQRLSVRRSGIDLVPTILDLFNVDFVPQNPRDFLSGRSLVPDFVRPPGVEPERRPVFMDMARGPYNDERQALIIDDLKLIASEWRSLGLYDLAQDPGEKQDLSKLKPEQLKLMREKLSDVRASLRRVPMPKK
jgi:arylsulfatase A-like enzyme